MQCVFFVELGGPRFRPAFGSPGGDKPRDSILDRVEEVAVYVGTVGISEDRYASTLLRHRRAVSY